MKTMEETTDETGYNGWTNYETWVTTLWIDNDEGSYHYARGLAQGIRNDSGVSEYPKVALADALKAWQEELMPELPASVWSDLLTAAFEEINWIEIAENYLSE